MDFGSVINKIMRDIDNGSTEPFLIYRDSDGGWHCDHTQNQHGEIFDWVDDAKARDSLSAEYTSAGFSCGSFAFVYDEVFRDRIRAEYDIARCSGKDSGNLHALVRFIIDNTSELSPETMQYLTSIERPLAALNDLCPVIVDTLDEGMSCSEAVTADAISYIEGAVHSRLNNGLSVELSNEDIAKDDLLADNNGSDDEYERPRYTSNFHESENPKRNEYDTTHCISFVELFGYDIEIGEDTERDPPYYVETNSRNGVKFSMRTDCFDEALKVYGEQLIVTANEVRGKIEKKARVHGIPHILMTEAHCIPGSKEHDFTGQLIIVDAKQLLPEYRASDSQLVLCTHGNGARQGAIGISVFGKELSTGNTVCYSRHNIAGIADPRKLPEWAVAKLTPKENDRTPLHKVIQQTKPIPTQAKKPSLLGRLDDAKTEAAAQNSERKGATNTKKRGDMEVS